MERFRGILAGGAAAVLAAGLAMVGGTAASAQTVIDPNAFYQVVSRHSGKALQAGSSGEIVVQWTPGDALSQQFQFVPAADGSYRLRARSTGLVLDVWEWNPDNGADIRMWTDLDGANQRFQVVEQADDFIRLVNQFSGRALDVWGWSAQDGARISQYDDHGGANQQWRLVPVGGGQPSPPPTPSPGECQGGGGGGGVIDPMPVSGNVASHDPSMIRTQSGYALFSTHDGVQTRTSPDRTRFTRTAAAIPGGATWAGAYNDNDPSAIWAPDISFHNGTYWLYYSVSTFGSNRSAIGLATSGTGQPGSFVDQGIVYDSQPGDDYNAIDPSLLVTSTGQWWLVFGSFWSGIKMIRIDLQTGKQSPQDQTRYSLASTPSTEIEGPTIVERCGFYYLFVAWGLCCRGLDSTYRIMVGRARTPTGPYTARDGANMLSGGGTPVLATHGRVVGPGGPAILPDTDGDILVYHYYDGDAGGATRLGLNRLSWADDGWPGLVE